MYKCVIAKSILAAVVVQSSKQVESKQLTKLKERVKKLTAALEKAKKGEQVDYSVLQEAQEAAEESQPPPTQTVNDDDANLEEPEDLTF